MSLSEVLTRFIAGGLIISVVSYLGNTDYKVVSGLAVLFPIVTVTGYYFLSLEVTNNELRNTVLFSILSLPTVVSFLVAFYYSLRIFSAKYSLIVGIFAWSITAYLIIVINDSYIGL